MNNRWNEPKITNTIFVLDIEELEDSFILNFTTGIPNRITVCESCGTSQDRPGFYDADNDAWNCAVCVFDPNTEGRIAPMELQADGSLRRSDEGWV
jgi:hypothetical protein